MNLIQLWAIYLFAGAAGGIMAGFARPHLHRWPVVFALGVLVALLVYTGLGLQLEGWGGMFGRDPLLTTALLLFASLISSAAATIGLYLSRAE